MSIVKDFVRADSDTSTDHPSRRACITVVLHMAELRVTRTRLAVAELLLGRRRHVTAESIYSELNASGARISLATVYNTLRQFQNCGLVRELAIDGWKGVFDTNTSNHHHFYIEEEDRIVDIPEGFISIGNLPPIPDGFALGRVEALVRLKKAE